MNTDEQYVTTLYANGPSRVMVVTANIEHNMNAVEDYIRQYKRFLKDGGTVLTTGTVQTSDGPINLGKNNNKRRFALTWME